MIKKSEIPVGEIFRFLKYFWENWNIQAVVLASLGFQVVLIFAAPSRATTKKSSCILTLWSIYLLADYFATFAIGLINNGSQIQSSNGPGDEPCGPFKRNSLAAFWAPFLLLHLGGPDTITAFSIEDNELWHRHMLSLVVQVLSVLLVFYRYGILTNIFRVPIALTFIAGFIKYAERTRSLNLASLSNLKKSMRPPPDPGPDYAQLMEEMESKQKANLPVAIDIKPDRANEYTRGDVQRTLDKLDVVKHGYKFYRIFRGLVVDHMFSFLERDESRNFFLTLRYEDAFRVMEMELNFMYDAMFTKMIAVHGNYYGYAFRFTCTILLVIATVLFSLQHPHAEIHNSRDLIVTYFLLGGGVALDFIAIVELIFSNWTVAALLNSDSSFAERSFENLKKGAAKKIIKLKEWFIQNKRWSEELRQYSLINHCLKKRRPKSIYKIIEVFGLTEVIDSCLYSKTRDVDDKLKELIYNEIKKKGKQATKTSVAKEIFLSKGEWTLLDYSCGPYIFSTVSQDVDYDECVLMWHIATEIFYFQKERENWEEGELANQCRYISEYLMYLLVMERKMTSAVAGIVEIRFRDTCEEAINFFNREKQRHNKKPWALPTPEEAKKLKKACWLYLKSMMFSTWDDIKYYFTLRCLRTRGQKREPTSWEEQKNKEEDKKRKDACKKLKSVNPQVKPSEVKGDRSKSLLFDACILARSLEGLCSNNNTNNNSNNKGEEFTEKVVWEMMSKVWVELLAYGASRCRGDAHALYLSKGGELLTFVWLLMAHFGLGDQFRIEAGHARAKLIVGKEKKEKN